MVLLPGTARTVPTAARLCCRDCVALVARHWTAACPVKGGGYICPGCYVKRMDADPDYRRVTRPDGSVGYQCVATDEEKGRRHEPATPLRSIPNVSL